MNGTPAKAMPGAALAAADRWPVGWGATGAAWLEASPDGVGTSAVPWPDAPGAPVSVDRWGDAARPRPWASVTKLLTALAVLVAVEEGTIGLDDLAGPPGATVRHLLAHASGLGPDGQVLVAPGRRRIYSNTGYEVLAEAVATRAAMPFITYLSEGVLRPLGMTGTSLPAGASPAAGAVGPLDDLLRLAGELLAPRLVSGATLQMAASVAFPGLAGVVPGVGRFDPCDWGLGPELRDGKTPHWTGPASGPGTFGHFGRAGTFLWVDPVVGVAAVALTDREFGPWALEHWPPWSDAVRAAVLAARGA